MKETIFSCQRCGHCCEGKGGIVLTLPELEKIAIFLDVEQATFQKKYTELSPEGKLRLKTKNNFCIFFNSKRGCLIHPVKPKVCAAWPFFRGNLIDEMALAMAKTYCPGINPKVSLDQFKRYGLDYLKKKQLISTDSNGPTALQVSDLFAK